MSDPFLSDPPSIGKQFSLRVSDEKSVVTLHICALIPYHTPLQLCCGESHCLNFHLSTNYCIAALQRSELEVQCMLCVELWYKK